MECADHIDVSAATGPAPVARGRRHGAGVSSEQRDVNRGPECLFSKLGAAVNVAFEALGRAPQASLQPAVAPGRRCASLAAAATPGCQQRCSPAPPTSSQSPQARRRSPVHTFTLRASHHLKVALRSRQVTSCSCGVVCVIRSTRETEGRSLLPSRARAAATAAGGPCADEASRLQGRARVFFLRRRWGAFKYGAAAE